MRIFRIGGHCVLCLTLKLVIYCVVGVPVVPITSVVGYTHQAAENQSSNKPMINSLLKIAFVVGAVSLLPIEAVNGQLKMTKIPRRLEEALINPNINEILRRNRQSSPKPTPTVISSKPVSPPPQDPVYSNESSWFSAIEPKADKPASVPPRLSTIEQTETPPRVARRPADLSSIEQTETPPRVARRPLDLSPIEQTETPLRVARRPVDLSPRDEVTDAPPAIRSQPRQTATTPSNDPAESDLGGNSELQKPLAPVKGQLRFRVTGVSAMIEGQASDLLIEVYNPTGHAIGPVEVNVQVPEELTVTRFDRDAWLDAERRIIAFQLDRIDPEAIEKIAMKGVSNTAGRTSLNVALMSGEAIVAERVVKTQVFAQQVARQQTFGDLKPSNTNRK